MSKHISFGAMQNLIAILAIHRNVGQSIMANLLILIFNTPQYITYSNPLCCTYIIYHQCIHVIYVDRYTMYNIYNIYNIYIIYIYMSTGMDPHIRATCTSYEYMSPADACHVWLKAQGCDLYRTGKVSEVQKKRE